MPVSDIGPIGAGFADPVQHSQAIFRCVLDAMASPGVSREIPVMPYAPAPLNAASTAVALTLLDDSTTVWLDAAADTEAVREFLAFHCGCPIVTRSNEAAFALVAGPMPSLDNFDYGSDEFPENSATVIVQVAALELRQRSLLRRPRHQEFRLHGRSRHGGRLLAGMVRHGRALSPRGRSRPHRPQQACLHAADRAADRARSRFRKRKENRLMYVAVKGGEKAIENAHRLLAEERRGDPETSELSLAQIDAQLSLAVDRVMTEGSLYDRTLAALAVKQARGDLIEAIFLLRAYRTTLTRFGASEPIDTGAMTIRRRISATYKDLPGGQVLGPTFDYTHRLLDFSLIEETTPTPAEEVPAAPSDAMPRVAELLDREGLIEDEASSEDGRVGDVTRNAMTLPADRDVRLQMLSRGDEGFVLALGYSTQRGYGRNHPFAGEIRLGEVEVSVHPARARLPRGDRRDHRDRMPDDQPVQGLGRAAAAVHPRLRHRLRPLRAQDHGDGQCRPRAARPRAGRGRHRPGAG